MLYPVVFLISAADKLPLHSENRIIKYAGDMYVIVPACSANTSHDKMEHIQDRATKNNVTINHEKTKEILFSANLRPGNDISHHHVRIMKESPAWSHSE